MPLACDHGRFLVTPTAPTRVIAATKAKAPNKNVNPNVHCNQASGVLKGSCNCDSRAQMQLVLRATTLAGRRQKERCACFGALGEMMLQNDESPIISDRASLGFNLSTSVKPKRPPIL
jgi:hypothetical protein